MKFNSETNEAIRSWWNQLQNDRAERARLRRATNLGQVAMTRSFYQLMHSLKDQDPYPTATAAMAGVLAHIRTDGSTDWKQLKEMRMRRLLRTASQKELLGPVSQVMRQLGTADVTEIAQTVYWWNENTRRDLALRFWKQTTEEE